MGGPSEGGDRHARRLASVAVATGFDPTTLADLDPVLYAEVVRAAEKRWTNTDELLATLVEQVDVLTRVTIKAHSNPKKPPRFGKPLRVKRPHDPTEKRKPFAGMPGIGGGVTRG